MALTGFAYPLRIEGGALAIASDAEYIGGLIRSFVETERGERLGLPEYGTPDYTFKAYRSFGFIAKDIEQRLIASIPQATFAVTASLNDIGEGEINIYWSFNDQEQNPIIFTIEAN